MRSIHKGKTPQQTLDYYPHAILQPDSEEARQARVAQRFRLEFLFDADRTVRFLGNKKMNAQRRAKARTALVEVENAKALMHEPQNAFLVNGHAQHVAWLLAELHRMVG